MTLINEGLQNLLDREVQKMRDETFAGSSQITLHTLICLLRSVKDRGKVVKFDRSMEFPTSPMSWRGRYAELAIGHTLDLPAPTVRELIEKLEGVLDKTLTGYKGGQFKMTKNTPVWCDNYGECHGWGIVGISETENFVYITTEPMES